MDEERQLYGEELAFARGETAEAISNLTKLNQRVEQIEEGLMCDPDCSQPTKDVESISACELNVAAPVATVALGNPPEKVVSPLGEWDGQRAATESALSGLDREFLPGRNWFVFVGGIAAVLRIGFFLKLAFDNDWIGHTGRALRALGSALAYGDIGQGKIVEAHPTTARRWIQAAVRLAEELGAIATGKRVGAHALCHS